MLPVNRILCPTDFSEATDAALQVADELSGHFGAELLLVYVIAPVPLPMPLPGGQVALLPSTLDIEQYRRDLEAHYRLSLDQLIADRLSHAKKARSIVATGDAAAEIVRLAAREDAGLIVIATHGRTGWRHLLFGSVAEKVIRTSTRPVLVVQSRRHEAGEQPS